MSLSRPLRPPARVTLVPLVDVLFIMLIYFMVTSVYLDLDMIPASPPTDEAPAAAASGQAPAAAGSTPLLVRLDAQGRAVVRGRTLGPDALRAALADAVAARPALEVVLLPSPRAPMQALATALDAIAAAEVPTSRVLRLEAAE